MPKPHRKVSKSMRAYTEEESVYSGYSSFMVRKAQTALSERGVTPTNENTLEWLRENYPKE